MAGPPSPLNPAMPVPANTVVIPLVAMRTTWLAPLSATKMFPEEATATPWAKFNLPFMVTCDNTLGGVNRPTR